MRKKMTTSKKIVYLCLLNGIAWVWFSYALAFFGRTEVVETLSITALTEIVAVVFGYLVKSLFEKRPGFGNVGKEENNYNEEDKSNGV